MQALRAVTDIPATFQDEAHDIESIAPSDVQAEQDVLGMLLTRDTAIFEVLDRLKPEHFYRRAHGDIYAAMLELKEEQKPIDLVLVNNRLKESGRLEAVGGRPYLTDLAMSVATTSTVAYVADIIREKALLRKLIKANIEVNKAARSGDEGVFERARRTVCDITNEAQSVGKQTLAQSLEVVYSEIEAQAKNPEPPGVPSGFADVDAITAGFHKGDLIVVAGRPSMGKTAWVLACTHKLITNRGSAVAFFSLEMSREQLLKRLLGIQAELEGQAIRLGKLSPDQWDRLARAVETLSETKLEIFDEPISSVLAIEAKVRQMIAGGNPPCMLVIDYLQLIEPEKSENRVQEVSKISRQLKVLARNLNLPVVVLSQLSRALKDRKEKRPELHDLRDSGSIEQDSDVVIMLHREEYYDETTDQKGIIELIIRKQRNGPLGTARLAFNQATQKFFDLFTAQDGRQYHYPRRSDTYD